MAEATDPTRTTRDRIRAVAVELFTDHGYEKTSLREIADRVGITKASLYYHYRSKQALLLAIVEPFLDDWAAAVDAAEHLDHTPANVRFVLEHVVDVMLRHGAATGLMVRDFAAVLTALAPRLEDLMELSKRVHSWLAGPNASSAQRIRAMAAVEALSTAITVPSMLPDVPEDEVRRVVLEAAAAVLGLEPAPRVPHARVAAG